MCIADISVLNVSRRSDFYLFQNIWDVSRAQLRVVLNAVVVVDVEKGEEVESKSDSGEMLQAPI